MDKTAEQIAAEAYKRGVEDTWRAVRGTNAAMTSSPREAYLACVEAAAEVLDKAIHGALIAILQEQSNAD